MPPPPTPPTPISLSAPLLPFTGQINDAVIDKAIFIIPEDTVPLLDKDMARRLTISYIYCVLLDSPNEFDMVDGKEKNCWIGPNGTVAEIYAKFPGGHKGAGVSKKTLWKQISRVITNVNVCRKFGGQYDGTVNWSGGQEGMIALDSLEAQIICDSMEIGNSLRVTKMNLNDFRRRNDLFTYGYNPIYTCYKNMKPRITPIHHKKQGSIDPESPWAVASNRQLAQLLLRLGEIDSSDPLLDQFKIDCVLPKWLDLTELVRINPCKVSYWDEVHKKCICGTRGSRECDNQQVTFPKNEKGLVDIVDGTYDTLDNNTTRKRILDVKYAKEVRLCLGVIKVENEKGEIVGI